MGINGFSVKTQTGEDWLFNKKTYKADTEKLKKIISNLKAEKKWTDGELNSVILVNSSSYKVLLTVLHEGSEVITYQANDSITLQIIEGSLLLHLKEEKIALGEGEMITINEKVRYSFDAVEDTAFLLTLVSEEIE
ncbi:MAG TPA: hypothetical protein VHO50_03180 [Bacteroidales bacterium]|nr:hypothetical protein [Bacteroidales bacterium]